MAKKFAKPGKRRIDCLGNPRKKFLKNRGVLGKMRRKQRIRESRLLRRNALWQAGCREAGQYLEGNTPPMLRAVLESKPLAWQEGYHFTMKKDALPLAG